MVLNTSPPARFLCSLCLCLGCRWSNVNTSMINWRFLPQSACTHTNKHFISKMINKTKPTAVPTNVSVNCFRVRKQPLHQLWDIRETGEVLPGWKHLLACALSPREEAAEWKSSPHPKGRSCLAAAELLQLSRIWCFAWKLILWNYWRWSSWSYCLLPHVGSLWGLPVSPSNLTASFEIPLWGPMPLREKGNIWVLLGGRNSCK